MIYYQYIMSYTTPKGLQCTVVLTKQAEDAEYDQELAQAKLFAKQHAYVNDGVVPTQIIETITTLTLTQYNAIVNGQDDIAPDPDILFPEE